MHRNVALPVLDGTHDVGLLRGAEGRIDVQLVGLTRGCRAPCEETYENERANDAGPYNAGPFEANPPWSKRRLIFTFCAGVSAIAAKT